MQPDPSLSEHFDDPREARWRLQQAATPPPLHKKPFWDQVFDLDAHGDEHPDLVRARTRIGWRITRLLAITQGRISQDEPLSNISPDPSPDEYERIADLPKPLPLVPPRPNKYLSRDENLSLEQAYLLFHETIRGLKRYFGNPISYKDPNTNCDPSNWFGILDQSRCFAVYPTIQEILLYEDRVIQQTLKYTVEHGQLYTHKYLRYQLVLTENEARSVTALARKQARQHMELDQEDERSVMTLRLQNFQQRAQRAMNLREELQGMKQEALVRGLTKTQPESFMDVFARVVSQTPTSLPKPTPTPLIEIIETSEE